MSSNAGISLSAATRVQLVADNDARLALIRAHPEAALVTSRLPLRANLTVLENIAVVPRVRRGLRRADAQHYALQLLEAVGLDASADKLDPDLTHEERFLTKLLRAVALAPPIILIDRPGYLLPDIYYPVFCATHLEGLEGRYAQCWIVDYIWNAALYPPPNA